MQAEPPSMSMRTPSWWSLLGVLATVSPAVAAPGSFQSWFDTRVAAEKPTVHTRFKVDLDGDGRADDVVCYAFPATPDASSRPVVLVGLATGERFALRDAAPPMLGKLEVCPQVPSQAKGRLAALHLELREPDVLGGLDLRFDKKGPLLVGWNLDGGASLRIVQRVDLLSQRASFQLSAVPGKGWESNSTEPPSPIASAAMVASGTKVPPAPAPTWVREGRDHWRGPRDADLKVHVMRQEDTLTVVARLTDDRWVPATGAGPEAVLAADHLELWWNWNEPGSKFGGSAQLGVARTAKGAPVVAWIQPPGGPDVPLPPVRWASPGHVEVDLPLKQIIPHPTTTEGAFTVVFSDVDGKDPRTCVSTSEVPPSPVLGAGLLFVPEPGDRFPRPQPGRLWRTVGPDDTLEALVPPAGS
jgi:hypothetical protein